MSARPGGTIGVAPWWAAAKAERCPCCEGRVYIAGGWWLTCAESDCLKPIRRLVKP